MILHQRQPRADGNRTSPQISRQKYAILHDGGVLDLNAGIIPEGLRAGFPFLTSPSLPCRPELATRKSRPMLHNHVAHRSISHDDGNPISTVRGHEVPTCRTVNVLRCLPLARNAASKHTSILEITLSASSARQNPKRKPRPSMQKSRPTSKCPQPTPATLPSHLATLQKGM